MDGWSYLLSFVLSLIATVLGLVAIMWIESKRRPQLELGIGAPGGIGAGDIAGRPECIWPHVSVRNKVIPRWLSRVYNGEPALACAAWITFETESGQPIFEEEMLARWSDTPEPRIEQIKTDKGYVARIVDFQNYFDIPSDAYTVLDVAMRVKGEDDCYGWNNESYLYGWRHPGWRLPKGKYIVGVRVKTGGVEIKGRFILNNDGPFESFKLLSMSA